MFLRLSADDRGGKETEASRSRGVIGLPVQKGERCWRAHARKSDGVSYPQAAAEYFLYTPRAAVDPVAPTVTVDVAFPVGDTSFDCHLGVRRAYDGSRRLPGPVDRRHVLSSAGASNLWRYQRRYSMGSRRRTDSAGEHIGVPVERLYSWNPARRTHRPAPKYRGTVYYDNTTDNVIPTAAWAWGGLSCRSRRDWPADRSHRFPYAGDLRQASGWTATVMNMMMCRGIHARHGVRIALTSREGSCCSTLRDARTATYSLGSALFIRRIGPGRCGEDPHSS